MILGSNSYYMESYNEYENHNFGIMAEGTEYTEIFSDATEELCNLESALYIADIQLEQMALEGASESEIQVAMEGSMSSFKDKIVSILQKIKAKVMEWFNAIKKFFQVLFTSGKEFAKKYRKDVQKAAVNCKGFKYKCYEINGGWGDLISEKNSKVANLGAERWDTEATTLTANGKNKDKSSREIADEYFKANKWDNEDNLSDFLTKTREEYLGNDGEKEEFEDFKDGSPSYNDMLNLLENGDKCIKYFENVEKKTRKSCDDGIKAVNNDLKGQTTKPGDTKKWDVEVALITNHCNTECGVANIKKEAIKACMKDAESILKALLRHKPKKESFSYYDDDDTSESILESAFRFL